MTPSPQPLLFSSANIKKIKQEKKPRSNSVPTKLIETNKTEEKQSSSTEEDLDYFKIFYDFGEEIYPEPEFLRRDISQDLQDLNEYFITSPIEINLDEVIEEFPRTNDDSSLETDNAQEPEQDNDDDESYPDVETYSSGYQVLADVDETRK